MTELNLVMARKVLDTVDAGLCSGLGKPILGQMCVEAAVCYAMGLPHGDNPDCVSAAVRALKIGLNDKPWSSNAARAQGLRRLAIAQLGSKGAVDNAEFCKRVSELTIRKFVPLALHAAAFIHPDQSHKTALEAAAKQCELEGSGSAAESAVNAANAAWSARSAAESAERSARNAAESAAWSARSAERSARNAAESAAESAANAAESAAWSAAWSARSAAERSARRAAESAAWSAAYDEVLYAFAEDVVQILIEMKVPGCQWLYLTEQSPQ